MNDAPTSTTKPRRWRSTASSSEPLTEHSGSSRQSGPCASTPQTSLLLLLLLEMLLLLLLLLLLGSPGLVIRIPEDIECRRWSEIERWWVVEH